MCTTQGWVDKVGMATMEGTFQNWKMKPEMGFSPTETGSRWIGGMARAWSL